MNINNVIMIIVKEREVIKMKEYHVSYMCIFSTIVEADSPEEAAEIAANECEYDVDGDPYIKDLETDEVIEL